VDAYAFLDHILSGHDLEICPLDLKLTSNPWVVKLNWLENAYSCPVLSVGDLDE